MRFTVVASGDLADGDERWLVDATVIAADAGATSLDRLGRTPDRLVGDLDSIREDLLARLAAAGTRIDRHPVDKDASDTELALEAAIAAGATEIVLLGAIGGPRLDHELANVLLLADPALGEADVRIVHGPTTARVLHAGRRQDLEAAAGDLVTLLPIGGDATGVRIDGVRWPLADATLRMGRSRGLEQRGRRAAGIGLAWSAGHSRRGDGAKEKRPDDHHHPGRRLAHVDIVVAAVIAVAFGVVFIAWNALYAATEPLFAALPPAQAVMYGIWLLPAVLVGLIVRRPGAAFFGGFVSAAVSVMLGSPYGGDALISGAIQGGARRARLRARRLPLVVAACRRRGRRPRGVAAAVHDIALYYTGTGRRLLARLRGGDGHQRDRGGGPRRLAARPRPGRHGCSRPVRGRSQSTGDLTRPAPTMPA